MQLIMKQLGFTVTSETLRVPIPGSDEKMTYQNDIEIIQGGRIKAIGSVKTSSKDRIDKIFLDKLMYNFLTNTQTPHFAIFLHDVQRAGKEPDYTAGQTFLTGHFKAYTIASVLWTVYIIVICVNNEDRQAAEEHIKSLDCLLCDDVWKYIEK